MNEDLEIRTGGAIAVDTGQLREAAARLALIADGCVAVRSRLYAAQATAVDAGSLVLLPTDAARRAAEQAAATAAGLRRMADVYELVELEAAIALAGATGATTARRDALLRADPELAEHAEQVRARWRAGRDDALIDDFGAVLPGFAVIGAGLVVAADLVGRGTVRHPLVGTGGAVTVRAAARPQTAAPTGLVGLAERVPGGEGGRIRVEKYTMPDGSAQFVAYVAGTQRIAGGDEPFDMTSNLELYGGDASASSAAVVAALEAAGAEPGATVHLVGHSQGAMVASHLALDGRWHVPTLVTFGNPVEAAVGAGTLSVAVRHRDDPVSALSAGGFAGSSGSSSSFVAERTVEEGGPFTAHGLDAYAETAALLDASTDPRTASVDDVLVGLGAATTVEAIVFTAERGRVRRGGGGA